MVAEFKKYKSLSEGYLDAGSVETSIKDEVFPVNILPTHIILCSPTLRIPENCPMEPNSVFSVVTSGFSIPNCCA